MQLAYTNSTQTTIRVTLADGETLDDLVGPMEVFVPVDEDNRHYAALGHDKFSIMPFFEPPKAP